MDNDLSKDTFEYEKVENSGNLRICDLDKFDRPREKMYLSGKESLTEQELIAILIRTGTQDENALDVAGKILQRIREENNYTDISLQELMKLDGVGPTKATTIVAAIELGRRLSERKRLDEFSVNSPESIANLYMEKLRYEQKESFHIIILDTKNKILSKVKISEGSLNSSIVHPREVFKSAIKQSANSIILVHNHPSGDTTPSKEDIDITKRLIEVGEMVGIKVLDHIIIGDDDYTSLRKEKYI